MYTTPELVTVGCMQTVVLGLASPGPDSDAAGVDMFPSEALVLGLDE